VAAVATEPELRVAIHGLDLLTVQSPQKTLLKKLVDYSSLISDPWSASLYFREMKGSRVIPEIHQLNLRTLRDELLPYGKGTNFPFLGTWIPIYDLKSPVKPIAFFYTSGYFYPEKQSILFKIEEKQTVPLPPVCNGYEGETAMREPWIQLVCESKEASGLPRAKVFLAEFGETEPFLNAVTKTPSIHELALKVRKEKTPLWKIDRDKDGYPEWAILDMSGKVWVWDSRTSEVSSLAMMKEKEYLQSVGVVNGAVILAIQVVADSHWDLILRNVKTGMDTSLPFGGTAFLSTAQGDYIGVSGDHPLVLDGKLQPVYGDPAKPLSEAPYIFRYIFPINCPSAGLVGFLFAVQWNDRPSLFYDIRERRLKPTWLPPFLSCPGNGSLWAFPYQEDAFIPTFRLVNARPLKNTAVRFDAQGFLQEAFYPPTTNVPYDLQKFIPLSDHLWLFAVASQYAQPEESVNLLFLFNPQSPEKMLKIPIGGAEAIEASLLPDGKVLVLARGILDGALKAFTLSTLQNTSPGK